MNLTSKTRHALKAILDIAFHFQSGPVQRRHIAVRQNIPTDSLDQLLMRLRAKGLVESVRGREGGYLLNLEPQDISVWDIADAVEETPCGMTDVHGECDEADAYAIECLAAPALEVLDDAVRLKLQKQTLDYLLELAEERMQDRGLDPISLMENRPQPGGRKSAEGC